MRAKSLLTTYAFSFCLCVAGTCSVAAGSLLVDHTGGHRGVTKSDAIHGIEFEVTTPTYLTHLGIWDWGTDGLTLEHGVGLWTDAGELLASTTIQTDNTSQLTPSVNPAGGWRFEPVAPLITLSPNQVYVIGAYYLNSSDPIWVGQSESTDLILHAHPNVVTGLHRHTSNVGGELKFPSNRGAFWTAIFGANALLAQVPEPSTFALFALTAPIMLLRRRVGGFDAEISRHDS